MHETEAKRLEALELKVEHLAVKLDALEDTVRQLFQELRALYEEEEIPQRQ